MTRYLIVAHQTADSPRLVQAVRDIRRSDPGAVLGLLVPATPVSHLAGWTRGEAEAVAAEAGERARGRLAAEGIDLQDVIVGDANPVYAVSDVFNRGRWDHVLVSTLAAGVSRWVKLDVVSRLSRELPVPVTHIVAE